MIFELLSKGFAALLREARDLFLTRVLLWPMVSVAFLSPAFAQYRRDAECNASSGCVGVFLERNYHGDIFDTQC